MYRVSTSSMFSALLARHQRRGINLRHHAVVAKASESSFSAFHSLPHVLQNLLQVAIPLPFDQQIQRVENRQPSLDQREKLLVEHQNVLCFSLRPRRSENPPESMPCGFTQ